MAEIMQWVSLIRDIGLILGVPLLIAVGVKLYSQQIEILKARNDLLRETQYDRAASLLESQKKVFLAEREALEKRIADLEKSESENRETLAQLEKIFDDTNAKIESMRNRLLPFVTADSREASMLSDSGEKSERKG